MTSVATRRTAWRAPEQVRLALRGDQRRRGPGRLPSAGIRRDIDSVLGCQHRCLYRCGCAHHGHLNSFEIGLVSSSLPAFLASDQVVTFLASDMRANGDRSVGPSAECRSGRAARSGDQPPDAAAPTVHSRPGSRVPPRLLPACKKWETTGSRRRAWLVMTTRHECSSRLESSTLRSSTCWPHR